MAQRMHPNEAKRPWVIGEVARGGVGPQPLEANEPHQLRRLPKRAGHAGGLPRQGLAYPIVRSTGEFGEAPLCAVPRGGSGSETGA